MLLVTGGWQYSGRYISLDSTEVLEDIMAGTWRLTAPLPSARWGLRAASVENIFVFGENILYYIILSISLYLIMFIMTIYLFAGGKDGDQNSLADILRYNKNHTWEEVAQMKEGRYYHAVAVMEDVSNLCP